MGRRAGLDQWREHTVWHVGDQPNAVALQGCQRSIVPSLGGRTISDQALLLFSA